MNPELLKLCLEKGILLDKETLKIIENLPDEFLKEFIDKISRNFSERFITKSFFSKNFEKVREIFLDKTTIIEKISLNFGISLEAKKEIQIKKEEPQIFADVKILSQNYFPDRRIEIGDFARYYRNRFNEMRKILQERKELDNLVSINRINGNRQSVSIIASVYKKRITKNKNLILEVEDLTGRTNLLVNMNNQEAFEKAKEILLDDVIGFKCSGTREMLFVNDIIFPDAHLAEKRRISEDIGIAFTSDIHVGSQMFLENNFLKFIDWLNGEVGDDEQKGEAKKIKYLFNVLKNKNGCLLVKNVMRLMAILLI